MQKTKKEKKSSLFLPFRGEKVCLLALCSKSPGSNEKPVTVAADCGLSSISH